ncbi:MAG: NAD kinase [Bacteroidia bacterium]|nr:NAD kinase [Bacteroidia bacterium]
MKVGLYARLLKNPKEVTFFNELHNYLIENEIEVLFHEHLNEYIHSHSLKIAESKSFSTSDLTGGSFVALISIGGDGTILDTVTIAGHTGVPILGINTGRLGFLSSIGFMDYKKAVNDLKKGAYLLDKRSLLQLESSSELFSFNYALNDFVIHKKESSSMITVHTFLNGEHLNSYWADGLIISTPTGSTGYSLSCGGPILFPKSSSFSITPIAPHNLNVRPVVIPDDHVLSFEIEGRSHSYLASLDSRSVSITPDVQMAIKRANFTVNLVRFENENFLKTLRQKLMWGLDGRN